MMTLRTLLLCATMSFFTQVAARNCPFDIVIDSQVVTSLECFESPQGGVMAQVTKNQQAVVVWDADAPCGDGKVYIHFAGGPDFAPMTAGAGATIHSYQAAMFDTMPVPAGTTGCADFALTTSQGICKTQWQVARHGTMCDANIFKNGY